MSSPCSPSAGLCHVSLGLARVLALSAVGCLLGVAACGGGERSAKPVPDTPRPPARPVAPPAAAEVRSVADAGQPISEAVARRVIAARFRRAGFRVRYDVRLERDGVDVTLDGFDVRRGVGFEYLAAAEANLDLSQQERTALSRQFRYVLVVDAGPMAAVLARVDAFLVTARDAAATQPAE